MAVSLSAAHDRRIDRLVSAPAPSRRPAVPEAPSASPQARITLRPANGMPMIVTPR
jgi:hypothetical protein